MESGFRRLQKVECASSSFIGSSEAFWTENGGKTGVENRRWGRSEVRSVYSEDVKDLTVRPKVSRRRKRQPRRTWCRTSIGFPREGESGGRSSDRPGGISFHVERGVDQG